MKIISYSDLHLEFRHGNELIGKDLQPGLRRGKRNLSRKQAAVDLEMPQILFSSLAIGI